MRLLVRWSSGGVRLLVMRRCRIGLLVPTVGASWLAVSYWVSMLLPLIFLPLLILQCRVVRDGVLLSTVLLNTVALLFRVRKEGFF